MLSSTQYLVEFLYSNNNYQKIFKVPNNEKFPRDGERVPSNKDWERSMETNIFVCHLQLVPNHEHMFLKLLSIQLESELDGLDVM